MFHGKYFQLLELQGPANVFCASEGQTAGVLLVTVV